MAHEETANSHSRVCAFGALRCGVCGGARGTAAVEASSSKAKIFHAIKLEMVAPPSRPIRPVWISTEIFKACDTFLKSCDPVVVVSADEFVAVQGFVHAKRCGGTKEGTYPFGTIGVTEFSGDQRDVVCVLPCEKAIPYLSSLIALPAINWTEDKKKPIESLRGEIKGCKG